ncbi:MAG: hypothetical protein PF638_02495 [Candidatus Delongbacteria bacterium]|jgi:hypothetical protein|nr:hypothetical protein [Candidatus Delongbacteria bacterium]
MKKIIASIFTILIISSFFFSCSDDNIINPGDATYFRITNENEYRYHTDSLGWFPKELITYTYDPNGRIVLGSIKADELNNENFTIDSIFYEDSNSLQPSLHKIYVSDGKGAYLAEQRSFILEEQKPKEIISECYNEFGELSDKYKTVYTYDNGLITNGVEYIPVSDNWVKYSEVNIFYTNSMIIRTEYSNTDGAVGSEQFIYTGDLFTEYYLDYSMPFYDSVLEFDMSFILNYEDDVVSEMITYSSDTSGYSDEQKETFEYNESNMSALFRYYWDDVLEKWSEDYRTTFGYDNNNNYILKETNQWSRNDSNYIASDFDKKTENIFESGKGNYKEIDKCMNPRRYYTGNSVGSLYPNPEPTKSFDKTMRDNSLHGIIRNLVNKKIEERKQSVRQ